MLICVKKGATLFLLILKITKFAADVYTDAYTDF